jgi:hypothetical protein
MLLVFVVEAVPANADVAAANVRTRERTERFIVFSFSFFSVRLAYPALNMFNLGRGV